MESYKFVSDGLKPTPEKVLVVKECKPPRTTREEIINFLGIVGYQYVILTTPLRRLIGKVFFSHGNIKRTRTSKKLKDSITYVKDRGQFPRRFFG